MKRLARLIGMVALLLSVATGGRLVWSGLQAPLAQPFVAATEAQVRTSLDRALAAEASPERVASLIAAHLAQDKRNWTALDSLRALAEARGLDINPALWAAFDAARAEDEGWLAAASACAACAWDVAQCPLDGTLICQGAVVLTPLPDLAGVTRAASAWVQGEEIDRFDLALSVVGLTATAAVIVSGGSSGAVKAGAGVLRMARGMGRLSGRLVDWGIAISARAIDMASLSRGDLSAAVRMGELAPLARLAGHLDEVNQTAGFGGLMHLLPLVDDAADAERLARVSRVAGPQVVGAAEVLGKTRLMRVTLRWSAELAELVLGALLLIGSLGSGLAQLVARLALRRLIPRKA